MTRADIIGKLRALIQNTKIQSAKVLEATEATAFADLGFDSLAMLDLVWEVEDAFGIQIDDSELVELKTVGQLLDLIEKKATAAAT